MGECNRDVVYNCGTKIWEPTNFHKHFKVQNLFSYPNAPPPSALLRQRRLNRNENTNSEIGSRVLSKKMGSHFCADLPCFVIMTVVGMS